MQSIGSTKLGTFMLLLAWLFFMGMLTFLFSKWLDYSMHPNKNTKVVTNQQGEKIISLKINRYNHYTLSGAINGVAVEFLVDTGATAVAVPGHLAEKLKLSRDHRISVSTANGDAVAYSTTINSLQLGDNIELSNVRANISDGIESNEVLLGMSALSQFKLFQSDGVLTMIYRP